MNYIKAKKNQKLDKQLQSIKKELNKFFNFKVKEPVVFILDSRKEMDILKGIKTEKWLVASTFSNMIFILKDVLKDSKNFYTILKHEYCHVYFNQIVDGNYPLWLNEGLANYLSGRKKTKGEPMDVLKLFEGGSGVYSVGYFWVDLLIKKFGRSKMKRLVYNLRIKQKMTPLLFSNIFYKVYGFKFNRRGLATVLKYEPYKSTKESGNRQTNLIY